MKPHIVKRKDFNFPASVRDPAKGVDKLQTFSFLSVVLIGLAVLGAGCFGSSSTTSTGPDGGVWKTSDHGVSWVHKIALVTGPKITADAASLSVQAMAMDRQDRNAIYLGTKANGLIYSLDGGDSWTRMNKLDVTDVKSISVDSKNPCTIYATSLNKIYKTKTCGRIWDLAFFDPRTDKIVTQIVSDWFNPTILYAGNNDGDILKSVDEGASWQVVKRANASVSSIVLSPQDSRVVYVGTEGDGLWKTLDAGMTWVQVRKEFGDIGDARRIIKVVPDPVSADRIYLVHRGGIARTNDRGQTWQAMNLIGEIGENLIADLAIDPNSNQRMIYTGPTALVFTNDAGQTWEAKKLPTTTSGGSTVLIDSKDGNIIYLGTLPKTKK